MTVSILSKLYVYSVILLLITNLLLMARLPLNAVVLLLLLEVVNPCFDIIRSKLYRDFCNKVADSVLILPDHLQKRNVFISLFLVSCVLSS
jgi:hypothetical protein